jgi:hypothetical protein
MNLVSSHQLFDQDLNVFKLGENTKLGNELRAFFKDCQNDYLWELWTDRQKITKALRHTESIQLRYLTGVAQGATTMESNQYMDVTWAPQADIPVFRKTIEWIETVLNNITAKQVEFGRIFISRLAPHSTIDLHTDEGRYFSYYDRFHFTVTASKDNLFIIKEQNAILDVDSFYWVNNHVPHRLENNSTEGRINFIVDARLS